MRAITAARADGLTIGKLSELTGVNVETIRWLDASGVPPHCSTGRVTDEAPHHKGGGMIGATASSKQRRTAVCELHVGAALVPPGPALCDGARDSGAELVAAAASREKRIVDALDVDAAILYGLDAVGVLGELTRGEVRIGEATRLEEFHGGGQHQSFNARIEGWTVKAIDNNLTPVENL